MGTQSFTEKRGNVFYFDPDNLWIIGLDTEDGAEHPLFDPRVSLPVDPGLKASIAEVGILENVVVRKNGDRAEVMVGRQRVKAARELNASLPKEAQIRVPVTVRRGDGDAEAVTVRVAENLHRRAADPVDMARDVQRLINNGNTTSEIAKRWGVTKATIERWLTLLELAPPVQKLVQQGKLNQVNAVTLAGKPASEQVERATEMVEQGTTAATARAEQRSARKAKEGAADTETLVAPGKRVAAKVVALAREEGALSDDFLAGVRWAIGDLSPRKINGLTDLIRRASGK